MRPHGGMWRGEVGQSGRVVPVVCRQACSSAMARARVQSTDGEHQGPNAWRVGSGRWLAHRDYVVAHRDDVEVSVACSVPTVARGKASPNLEDAVPLTGC